MNQLVEVDGDAVVQYEGIHFGQLDVLVSGDEISVSEGNKQRTLRTWSRNKPTSVQGMRNRRCHRIYTSRCRHGVMIEPSGCLASSDSPCSMQPAERYLPVNMNSSVIVIPDPTVFGTKLTIRSRGRMHVVQSPTVQGVESSRALGCAAKCLNDSRRLTSGLRLSASHEAELAGRHPSCVRRL